jgi:tRNA 5-methylaminomethyl-2-thiouridine biosynthesis bifunctional protein
MAEAVEWLPDGTPRSPRFDDIYRSSTGGLEQARHVFLHGCGLPQAWAGRPQWRILETGFGLGLNFLAAWRAWKDDPQRPRMLHFATVEAWPVAAADLRRSAAPYPDLVPLAEELAAQWFGLLPGVHRLSFELGRVLLTIFVGDVRDGLRQEPFHADSIFLDGFDPQRNAAMWELATLKAAARHSRRGTTIATWTVAGDIRRELAQCGYAVEKAEGPAAGASGLPVGLIGPHYSPDDNLLSRLSRCGVRVTLQQVRGLLPEGEDWRATGVLEHRIGEAPAPLDESEAMRPWTRQAAARELEAALLDEATVALWHEQGGWIKPTALVRAWLAEPGVTWRGNVKALRVESVADGWAVIDAQSREVARAGLVVVAAAHASAALLGAALPLQPVRGQVSWAAQEEEALPPFPVQGNGHFIPHVPTRLGPAWFCGSTFDRDQVDRAPRDDDHRANFARLQGLLPAVAQQVAPAFAKNSLQVWTGVRCAPADRRPLLGEIAPGLWVSTAMGSRGLTFAALCAELLAARVHGEPLPLDRRLAKALDVARLKR